MFEEKLHNIPISQFQVPTFSFSTQLLAKKRKKKKSVLQGFQDLRENITRTSFQLSNSVDTQKNYEENIQQKKSF